MPGVYFVLDQNEELLYIGQSKSLGKRLYNHFPPSSNGCTIKEGEKLKGACYLYTTSCPKEKPWERLSLEEYLINEPVGGIKLGHCPKFCVNGNRIQL